jgi:hypothetical protein
MNERGFWRLGGVSDGELEAQAVELLSAGARLEARLVAHLAEMDARKLALRAGYSSLYDYCRTRLQLSDYEAFARIAAARVARRFPVVFEMLDRREVTLTTLCEVREFLNDENHAELLEAVKRKTKLQVREVLAQRFPRADVTASTRPLPNWDPLSPGRYRLEVTLSTEQKGKLEYARGLLGHAEASGDLARVLERGLDLLIAKLERQRFGTLSDPSKTRSQASQATTPTNNRNVRQHVPMAVRREVVARDGACCAFVGEGGHRCGTRERLEFHHKLAWARQGADTAENLQLLCRAHNQFLAELELGTSHVEQAIAERRKRNDAA